MFLGPRPSYRSHVALLFLLVVGGDACSSGPPVGSNDGGKGGAGGGGGSSDAGGQSGTTGEGGTTGQGGTAGSTGIGGSGGSGTGGATTRTCPAVISSRRPATSPRTSYAPCRRRCACLPAVTEISRASVNATACGRARRMSASVLATAAAALAAAALAAAALAAVAALDKAVPVAAVEPEASRPGHRARATKTTHLRQATRDARALVVENVTRRK